MQKITLQEAFNRSWQAFVVEGKPRSVTDGGSCRYVGENGARCIIGLCIPNDMIRGGMEGKDVYGLFSKFPEIEALFHGPTTKFALLQDVHDDWEERHHGPWGAYVKTALKEFAAQHSLTIPEAAGAA